MLNNQQKLHRESKNDKVPPLQRNPSHVRGIQNEYQSNVNYSNNSKCDLRIIVVRNAERLDHVLGSDWYKTVFGGATTAPKETYQNSLLPHHLPYRSMTRLYEYDPPISRRGEMASMEKGKHLAQTGVRFDYCYASPASRAVLTASAILRGMHQNDVPIRIEPLLFEPLNWNKPLKYLGGTDPFLKPFDWMEAGHNADQAYRPKLPKLDMQSDEQDYYERNRFCFGNLLQHAQNTVQNTGLPAADQRSTILVVGHASSLNTFSRIALGKQFNLIKLKEQSRNAPYLNAVILERDANTHQWNILPSISSHS